MGCQMIFLRMLPLQVLVSCKCFALVAVLKPPDQLYQLVQNPQQIRHVLYLLALAATCCTLYSLFPLLRTLNIFCQGAHESRVLLSLTESIFLYLNILFVVSRVAMWFLSAHSFQLFYCPISSIVLLLWNKFVRWLFSMRFIDQPRGCGFVWARVSSNVAGFIYINEIDMQRLVSSLTFSLLLWYLSFVLYIVLGLFRF